MKKFNDLTGKIFGRLLVIGLGDRPQGKSHNYFWKCLCDCGQEKIIDGYYLTYGRITSCGCKYSAPWKKDIIGRRFERCVVIKEDKDNNSRSARYECLCDCGNMFSTLGISLINGNTGSCGCLQKERSSESQKTKNNAKRLEYGRSCFNRLFRSYRKSAQRRNLCFDLTEGEFESITKSNCHYCGQEPKQIRSDKGLIGEYVYNGIDRVDSSMGYSLSNVVPCCFTCNSAKRTMGELEFYSWVSKVYEHIKNRIYKYE